MISADAEKVRVECTREGETAAFRTCKYRVARPIDLLGFQMPSDDHFIGQAKTDLTNLGAAQPP